MCILKKPSRVFFKEIYHTFYIPHRGRKNATVEFIFRNTFAELKFYTNNKHIFHENYLAQWLIQSLKKTWAMYLHIRQPFLTMVLISFRDAEKQWRDSCVYLICAQGGGSNFKEGKFFSPSLLHFVQLCRNFTTVSNLGYLKQCL